MLSNIFNTVWKTSLIPFHQHISINKNPIGFSSSWDFNENNICLHDFSLFFLFKLDQNKDLQEQPPFAENFQTRYSQNFCNFTVLEYLFDKFAGLVFSSEYCDIFINSFFYWSILVPASWLFNSTHSRWMTHSYRSEWIVYDTKICIKYWSIKRFLDWYV